MIERASDQTSNWPGTAMILGGAVMIAIWPIYTTLHGPTSFNLGKELLGQGPEFWGSMMEGPSLLLMAAGLWGSRERFPTRTSRSARIGFRMAMTVLLLTGIANLVILAVWPPLLAPLLGIGLILLARDDRTNPLPSQFSRRILLAMGATQIYAFLWVAIVRPDMVDRINGYRIYGIVANVMFGVGWILLGLNVVRSESKVGLVAIAAP